MKKLLLLSLLTILNFSLFSQQKELIIPRFVEKDSLEKIEDGIYLLKPTKIAKNDSTTYYFHSYGELTYTYVFISIWVKKREGKITYFNKKKYIPKEYILSIENWK